MSVLIHSYTVILRLPVTAHHTHRDVDDIHDMMDDIQEQNEIAEEISGALSQPIGFAQELDEVSSTKEHYFSVLVLVQYSREGFGKLGQKIVALLTGVPLILRLLFVSFESHLLNLTFSSRIVDFAKYHYPTLGQSIP